MMRKYWSEIRKYPSAVVGTIIILAMIAVSVYTLVAIPYSKAVSLWRGGENIWADYPRNAGPAWLNWFYSKKKPTTMVLDTAQGRGEKRYDWLAEDFGEAHLRLEFDYRFDAFPQEIALYLNSQFVSKRPFISFTWVTPDGREISLGERTPSAQTLAFRISQDNALRQRLGGHRPEVGLFRDPASPPEEPVPLKGTYQLRVEGLLFEPGANLDAKLVVYGQLHGWAGTDHRRRDLSVALLWGAPVALAFGLLAAVGTTITTLIIAAIGAWYGRWVDAAIQRITEVNLILPVLPILIMIGALYSRSIWTMLGAVILLGIFGGGIKTNRAIFLQVRESPYIEAARAYGASNLRIVFRYMIPRVIPILVPQFVVVVPAYVFLEATLSVLGLGDPILPTWGKLLSDARTAGALYNGYYYWMLEPAVLLMIVGLGFSMLGFALDRVFNPRLREL